MNKEKNRAYWKGRFEQLQGSLLKPADDYIPELENAYKQAQKSIEKDIAIWYQRFADNNGIIDMAEARRLLNSDELKELKWDLNEYIKYGKENAINQKWIKELENASAKVHIKRLEAIKLQARQAMEKLYGGMENKVESLIKDTYSESLYKSAFEIAKGMGIGTSITKIDEDMLNKTARKPWAVDKKNFSERIWGYKATAVNTINQEINKGLISGKTVDEISKSLAKATHVNESNAKRLVMTEIAYFSSVGTQECFNRLDVERFEVLGTLDNSTCGECGGLDGKVFNMQDYEVGVNAPPFHCNCRCTTVPYFDDEFTEDEKRASRDEDGKTVLIDGKIKYEEWKKEFVGKEERKAEYLFRSHEQGKEIDKDLLDITNQAIDLVPQKVKDALANGTVIDIGKIGASQYDYINDIMYVARGADIEQVVHEIGHLVEKKLIPTDEVEQFKLSIIGLVNMSDIITETYYDNEHNPIDIFILNNSKFVTPYQGRVYVDDITKAFDASGDFRSQSLLEFISEPFRELIEKPIGMKRKHPEFYNFLVRWI